jgi:hypothetical protein
VAAPVRAEAATAARPGTRLTVPVAAPGKRARLTVRVRGPLPGCATVLVRHVRRGTDRVRVPTTRAHHRRLRRGRYLVEILRPDARVVARRILVVPRPGRRARLVRVASLTRVPACTPASTSPPASSPPVQPTAAAGILRVEPNGTPKGEAPSAAAIPPLPPPGPATSVVPLTHRGIPGWAFAVAFAAWAAAVALLVARAGRPRRSRGPSAY